jgi:hypothetical protein
MEQNFGFLSLRVSSRVHMPKSERRALRASRDIVVSVFKCSYTLRRFPRFVALDPKSDKSEKVLPLFLNRAPLFKTHFFSLFESGAVTTRRRAIGINPPRPAPLQDGCTRDVRHRPLSMIHVMGPAAANLVGRDRETERVPQVRLWGVLQI